MLSTTPSNQGELLIQQGELAGRRYPYEAIVCQNPTCRCEHVTLKCFLETPAARPPAPVSVCLEMDLERREISNIEELRFFGDCAPKKGPLRGSQEPEVSQKLNLSGRVWLLTTCQTSSVLSTRIC